MGLMKCVRCAGAAWGDQRYTESLVTKTGSEAQGPIRGAGFNSEEGVPEVCRHSMSGSRQEEIEKAFLIVRELPGYLRSALHLSEGGTDGEAASFVLPPLRLGLGSAARL